MKVLVLNGSPKKQSDTFRLTDAFLKGLNRNGEHEVNVVNVIEKNIAPCRGCFGCWQQKKGHCVFEDDLNPILDMYCDADLIIWSFPLIYARQPIEMFAAKTMECVLGLVGPDYQEDIPMDTVLEAEIVE